MNDSKDFQDAESIRSGNSHVTSRAVSDIQEFDSKWDGILLSILQKERGANQQFISYTMGLRSVQEYVIKKGRPHGHRHGKKPGDK